MSVARPVMEVYPYAYLFFVPFILLNSFIILNVFVAIIVNGAYECRAEHQEATNNKSIEKENYEVTNNSLTREEFEQKMSNLENHILKLEKLLNGSKKSR